MSATQTPEGQVRRAVTFPLDMCEWRDSGDPDRRNETTLRGHAAIFNSLSDDLGGFKELIAPGAFRAALRKDPDVRLLVNHDPNYVMARTASGTLELREDGTGLHVFARVERSISWVEDLRTSMRRGDIDQMSFAFTLEDDGDEWAVTDDGQAIRTIQPDGVKDIFDASVVAFPAYEHTSVDMRSVLNAAVDAGKLPESLRGSTLPVEQNTAGGQGIGIALGGAAHESHNVGSAVQLERAKRLLARRVEKTPTPKEH
jgi:HK97 family phage prohead protease